MYDCYPVLRGWEKVDAQKPSVSEGVCSYLHTLRFHNTPPDSAAAGLQRDIVA